MALKKKKKVAAEAADAQGSEESSPAKKGKGNLVPAVVLAVGLLGGGWFMGGGSGGGGGTAAADPTTTTTIVEGPVVALDSITLNLADGRFLKVGLALQTAEAGGGEGGHGGGGDDDPRAAWAKALDEAITVLGGSTREELSSPEGRAHAKEVLSERVRERYHGEVLEVYFTEFVMQ